MAIVTKDSTNNDIAVYLNLSLQLGTAKVNISSSVVLDPSKKGQYFNKNDAKAREALLKVLESDEVDIMELVKADLISLNIESIETSKALNSTDEDNIDLLDMYKNS